MARKKQKGPAKFTIGPRPYQPRTEKNRVTWGRLTKLLDDGPATLDEMREAVTYSVKQGRRVDKISHADFIPYAIRGEHIRPSA